jgi:defect-in-organelle-trafficking protein DotC
MPVDMPPMMTLEEAQRLYDRPAVVQPVAGTNVSTVEPAGANAAKSARNEAQRARAQALVDTGLKVGLRAGLAWQLHNVEAATASLSRDLETIYNFNPLLIQQRVVPPVITEARNLYNQDGDFAVRLSGAFYKIERQARFTSVAPNFREYLTFQKVVVDRNDMMSMLMPSTDEEREVWRVAVKNGWTQGVEQANIMLTQAMDRLNRDYAGMTRFHSFVIKGKISLPAIASQDIPVTRKGETLAVDETLLRITTLPEFNSKLGTWQGVVISTPSASSVGAVVGDASSVSAGATAKVGAGHE